MHTVMPRGRQGGRFEPTDLPGFTVTERFPWRRVLACFAAVAVALSVVVTLSSRAVTRGGAVMQGPAWLDAWFQYDSGWYYQIAVDGYSYVPGQQSSIAFFPTYPMLVRAAAWLLGDVRLAGTLIALGAGAGVVVVFGRWCWRVLPRRSALGATALLMLYPYAVFLYGAMYADSVFLLASIGAFMLLERRMYWLAGLVGALATAGRPVGAAVLIGLVVRALELLATDRADGERVGLRDLGRAVAAVRWRQAGVLLSGAGLAGWCVYLWIAFGNPLAFIAVESAPGWDQGVGPHTWFKVSYVEEVLRGPLAHGRLLTLQALGCLVAVLLLRRVWRLFGWGYLAYALVVVAIPILGTDDFMGTGRYVLVAFPVVAAAGELLATRRRPWVLPLALVASALLLVLVTMLYGRGIEVS